MAASTLHTFLIKLGFDTAGLTSGGAVARNELNAVGASARELAAAAAPAAAGLNSIGAAGKNAASGLITARDAATALNASTGPIMTSQAFAQQALRSTNAAAGPLVAGLRGVNGALAASGPAASLASTGFMLVDKNGSTAALTAQKMGTAMGGANNRLNETPGAAMRAAGALEGVAAAEEVVSARASFMNRTLSMAFAFSGGVAITNLFSFVGNALLGFNSRLQQAHLTFDTLLGDSDKADKFIQQMQHFADFTPFDFAGVEDAAQRMMAMGFAADSVLPSLMAIGDAVSALGSGGMKEKLDRVTLAIGQMLTAGVVHAQDMRQLTEAGIPAWQMLADGIHKTVAETMDLSKKGLIPAKQAIDILLTGMEERFRGMMEKQSRTAQGAFSTILDAAYRTISGAVQPLFDALTTGLVALADFFTSGGGKYVAPFIYAVGLAIAVGLIPRLWGAAAAGLAATISIAGIGVPILPLIALLTIFGIAWQENFGGLRDTLAPVIAGVWQLATAVMGFVASSGLLIPALTILVTLLAVRWVGGLVASGVAMVANAVAATIMSGALTGLSVSEGAAAIASSGLTGALLPLVALLGGPLIIAIGLFIAAAVLIILFSDRIGQGLRVLELIFASTVKGIVDAASTLPVVGDHFKGLSAGLQTAIDAIRADMARAEAEIGAKSAAGVAAGFDPFADIKKQLADMAGQFTSGGNFVIDETRSLVERFGFTLGGVIEASRQAGGQAMSEMAKAINDHQNAPMEAFKTLLDNLKNNLDPMVETARLYGMLYSKALAGGLESPNAGTRAQAIATQKLLQERIRELGQAKPSIEAIRKALEDVNNELNATARNSGLSALNSAFDQIKSSAHRFFDQLHQDNLKAIDEAVRHKNAILDAKAALNQAPVTAAQRALDFQRRQIEEWRLRMAVSQAKTPEEYRDAVLALRDFLAQTHIDEMQAQVDAAKAKIDAQKQANEASGAAQREAENRRYRDQQESFDRQLELLRRYLEKHPGEWQKTNAKVLALLKSYGIDYKSAGSRLGANFVTGLREQIAAAVAAAKAMAGVLPGLIPGNGPPPSGYGGAPGAYYGPPQANTGNGSDYKPPTGYQPMALGSWRILSDNVRALLHKDEMVAPAEAAALLRELGSSSFQPTPSASFRTVAHGPGEFSSGRGGGTIIFQIGEQKLAEMTDESLSVQDSVYRKRRGLTLRSMR